MSLRKVDCVKHPDVCKANGIHAYPTLRLYVEGKQYGDYRNDRTVQHFTDYLATIEREHAKKLGGSLSANEGEIYDTDRETLKVFSL